MKEPLGLPKGSVRSIIAIILTVTLVYLLVFGSEIQGEYWTVISTILAFYFGTRMNSES